MKRKNDFIIRKVAEQYVIVAIGEESKRFNGMIKVNTSGAFIWDLLENEIDLETIVKSILVKYDIDEDTARADAEKFIGVLKNAGAIE